MSYKNHMAYADCYMCYTTRAEYIVVAGDLMTREIRDFGVCMGHLEILTEYLPSVTRRRGYMMNYGRFHVDMFIHEAVEDI